MQFPISFLSRQAFDHLFACALPCILTELQGPSPKPGSGHQLRVCAHFSAHRLGLAFPPFPATNKKGGGGSIPWVVCLTAHTSYVAFLPMERFRVVETCQEQPLTSNLTVTNGSAASCGSMGWTQKCEVVSFFYPLPRQPLPPFLLGL